jgi:hypothetical protein
MIKFLIRILVNLEMFTDKLLQRFKINKKKITDKNTKINALIDTHYSEIYTAENTMKVIRIDRNYSIDCRVFTIANPSLTDIFPSLFGLHKVLFNHPEFTTF